MAGLLRFCQPAISGKTPIRLFVAMKSPATLSLGAALLLSLGLAPVAIAAPDVKSEAAQIDQLVAKDLAKSKLKPNAPASDEVFLRRVYLDVAGRVPTKKETLEFLNSKDADKRAKLIDALLAGDGYAQNFYNFWADVLRLQSQSIGGGSSLPAGYAYERWLKDCLRSNEPYDQMVRELVGARGTSYENGAIGFYIRDYNMPLDNMAVTTQVFLGTSIVCAQCHNHPFDKWSQMDYYQMAAHTYGMEGTNRLMNPDFYKTLGAGGGYGKAKGKVKGAKAKAVAATNAAPEAKPSVLGNYKRAELNTAMVEILRPLRYNRVVEDDKKALKLPHDYKYPNGKPLQVVEPVIPATFSKDGKIAKPGESASFNYADWMTSKDNPRFSLVIANRLWRKLMGIGLIEPVDEITDSTVPSNPALMTWLEQKIKDLNFDMKEYLRIVLNSQTYQRAACTQDLELGEAFHFQGPLLRRMSAEQIWDSMVALYKPAPDRPSRTHDLDEETAIRRVEWLDRALNSLTTEEAIDCAKKIADVQKKLAEDVRQAQHQLAEATKAKDDAAIRAAKRTVGQQRRNIDLAVEDIVFTMGWKKFAQLAHEGKLADVVGDADFAKEIETVLKAKKEGEDMKIEEALAVYNEMQRSKLAASMKSRQKEDAEHLKVAPGDQRKAFVSWEQARDTVAVRAADLKSPAPNGHFLREFGQSDRELVNNANADATVGQSLMMLNGRYFKTLMNPYTMIGRALVHENDPDKLIDTIYLSLLSRHPTADEVALLRPMVEGSKTLEAKGEALWSVINTREFLFIE